MNKTEQHARRYGSKGAFLGTKQIEKPVTKSSTNVGMTKKPGKKQEED